MQVKDGGAVKVRERVYTGQKGSLYRPEREVVQVRERGCSSQRGRLHRSEGVLQDRERGCADQKGRWLCRSQREVVQVREGVCIGQKGRLFRLEREVVNVIGIGCADHTQGFYYHNLIYRHDGTGTDRKEMKACIGVEGTRNIKCLSHAGDWVE